LQPGFLEAEDTSQADLLFDLKREAAETGFKIGVLAGVILAGSDQETVGWNESDAVKG